MSEECEIRKEETFKVGSFTRIYLQFLIYKIIIILLEYLRRVFTDRRTFLLKCNINWIKYQHEITCTIIYSNTRKAHFKQERIVVNSVCKTEGVIPSIALSIGI